MQPIYQNIMVEIGASLALKMEKNLNIRAVNGVIEP